jgi:hypothetical protein
MTWINAWISTKIAQKAKWNEEENAEDENGIQQRYRNSEKYQIEIV